jgi:uncharacterized membrane protein YeaQ/YmgE (transglycosylase-associated protein family)
LADRRRDCRLARGSHRKGLWFRAPWNIVIGIVGGLIAGWLLPMIGIFNIGGIVGAIVYSVIGAVILLLIVGLIKR